LERRLAAILAADVAGYTALMGSDEAGTLRRLTDLRRNFLEPLIDEHHGRVVKLDAPVPQRVFWCTFEGAVAIVLLVGGGLSALQAMVISTGLPFTVVLLLMCWAIFMGLKSEKR